MTVFCYCVKRGIANVKNLFLLILDFIINIFVFFYIFFFIIIFFVVACTVSHIWVVFFFIITSILKYIRLK